MNINALFPRCSAISHIIFYENICFDSINYDTWVSKILYVKYFLYTLTTLYKQIKFSNYNFILFNQRRYFFTPIITPYNINHCDCTDTSRHLITQT